MKVKVAIQGMVGARIMENCEKYLGLPMVGGKSKVNTFKDLREKITTRVMGWKEKYISKAGREILIKMVAQAIPTYTMGMFKIPKALCDTINSTLEKYWWGQTKNERKIHWINWKKLYTPKKKGGMGFRDIQAFNLALLAKQAWQLIQDTHSLFYKVYKSRYFPTCTFMEAGLGNNPSYVWRSLLAARKLIREGSIWQWNREKFFDLFAYRTQMEIMAIPLSRVAGRDKLCWKENKGKVFSVKSA
ncbi:putative mitochondrial protein AtMg00310 [Castanea sativa]|uniref:putative mitochondrial protein AtMg00310 n=1 Tax=Castanea sativa TaxID=21020 RepID=UPI003F650CF3